MERLKSRDLLAISLFLQDLYAFRDLEGLVSFLLAEIPRLVPSDITVYGELNPRARRFHFESKPRDARFPGWEEVYRAHLREHPFSQRYQGGGGGKAIKLSDLITPARFRDTGLYQEFFRRIGVDREMVVWLPAPPPLQVTLAVHRVRHDFSERDRFLLNALRDHLVQAYRNAEAVTLLRSAAPGQAVVLLAPGRRPEVDAAGRTLITKHFGVPGASSSSLPDELAGWVRQQEAALEIADDTSPPQPPLHVERDGSALTVRFFPGPTQRLLLLTERRLTPDLRALDALSLTPREIEVLVWVAQGKTNDEIGRILSLSPRTVAKHLERMYPRLGVENRTAAAARAFEVLRGGIEGSSS